MISHYHKIWDSSDNSTCRSCFIYASNHWTRGWAIRVSLLVGCPNASSMLQAASTILFLQEWTLASRSLAWLNLNNINRKPQEGHQKSDIRNPWDVNRMSTHHETSITWRGSLHDGHRGPAKVYGPRPQPNFWGWWKKMCIQMKSKLDDPTPFCYWSFFFGCISTWMKRACRRVVAFPLQFQVWQVPWTKDPHQARLKLGTLVLWSGRISGSPLPGGSASGRLELLSPRRLWIAEALSALGWLRDWWLGSKI